MIAKWSAPAGESELEGERQRTSWLYQFDQKSPEVVDWLISPTGACLVTTAIAGVPASELKGSQLINAWPSMVTTLRWMHDLPLQRCPFERRLNTMLAKAEDVVRRAALNVDLLEPDDRTLSPEALLQRVRSGSERRRIQESNDLVVCHGDACLPNLMVDPDTLKCAGVIDLGRLGVADRYADLALLIANAQPRWSSDAAAEDALARFADTYGRGRLDDDRLNYYLKLDPLTWG